MTNIVIHLPTEAEIHHVKRPATIQTPHGPSKAHKGDFVLTIGDDQWPVDPVILQQRYSAANITTENWLVECLEWNRANGIAC